MIKTIKKDKDNKNDGDYLNDTDNNKNKRRKINDQILKNKGLQRYRNKKFKNSRTKTREKWRKRKIKIKGVRQEYKPLDGVYIGEKTGIKDDVVKSISLVD